MRGYMYQKEFHTRKLIGVMVVVVTKIPGLKFCGTMLEYFERNDNIVLKDYIEMRMEDGKWLQVDKGDLMIIKGYGWSEMKIKRWKDV